MVSPDGHSEVFHSIEFSVLASAYKSHSEAARAICGNCRRRESSPADTNTQCQRVHGGNKSKRVETGAVETGAIHLLIVL